MSEWISISDLEYSTDLRVRLITRIKISAIKGPALVRTWEAGIQTWVTLETRVIKTSQGQLMIVEVRRTISKEVTWVAGIMMSTTRRGIMMNLEMWMSASQRLMILKVE